MNVIQRAKEYFRSFDDVKLLDEYDMYLNMKSKGANDHVFQQLIENELHERDLLDIKLSEDDFEQQFNLVIQ